MPWLASHLQWGAPPVTVLRPLKFGGVFETFSHPLPQSECGAGILPCTEAWGPDMGKCCQRWVNEVINTRLRRGGQVNNHPPLACMPDVSLGSLPIMRHGLNQHSRIGLRLVDCMTPLPWCTCREPMSAADMFDGEECRFLFLPLQPMWKLWYKPHTRKLTNDLSGWEARSVSHVPGLRGVVTEQEGFPETGHKFPMPKARGCNGSYITSCMYRGILIL